MVAAMNDLVMAAESRLQLLVIEHGIGVIQDAVRTLWGEEGVEVARSAQCDLYWTDDEHPGCMCKIPGEYLVLIDAWMRGRLAVEPAEVAGGSSMEKVK